MITNPMEMRALIHHLTSSAWAVAAIGVLFETALGEQLAQPRTLDELAAACPSLSARRIEKIVGVAVAYGVVVADAGRYRLAEGVMPAMCGPLRQAVAGEIRSHLLQPIALLDSVQATVPTTIWDHTDPRVLQSQGDASAVLPAMIKMQMAPALGDLAARLDRPGAKLLDVGTGVGSLAISACRTFPNVHVVGLDIASTPLELARGNIAKAGLGARIELRQLAVQDLRDEGVFACVWLPAFFIPPAHIRAAVARAAAALEPGGWLLMGIPGAGDPKQRAVNELVGAAWGGPTEAPEVAEGWLREAGLHEVRTMPGPPWAPSMIVGMR